jgi:hypothetical protein
VKLYDFMTDARLVGVEFMRDSWRVWRVIARLIDGDAPLLSTEDQALALKLTGRSCCVTPNFSELPKPSFSA